MTETGTRRVFFALWPPAEILQEIDLLADNAHALCGGRRMRRDSLHLTLAFIGLVNSGQLDALKTVADSIRSESFALQLDHMGYWPHNHIAWVGCSQAPFGQRRLFDCLSGGLAAAGFPLEKRSFAPHVTLLRNARCDKLPELTQPVAWNVSDFTLVESELESAGARYRTLERWPLISGLDKKSAKGS